MVMDPKNKPEPLEQFAEVVEMDEMRESYAYAPGLKFMDEAITEKGD